MTETYTPRPGSHIYRRTDGGDTEVSWQVSGATHIEDFSGFTDEERLAAEMSQPQGYTITDAGDPSTATVVETYLGDIDTVNVVVVGPSMPPFGTWEELETWPV